MDTVVLALAKKYTDEKIEQAGGGGIPAGFGTPTASATQLESTEQPTVSIEASGPNTAKVFDFKFGIPSGKTGDSAGFDEVTATIDDTIGIPKVEVTTSGPDTAKKINFAFSGLKGESSGENIVPIPSLEKSGFSIVVNSNGDSYELGHDIKLEKISESIIKEQISDYNLLNPNEFISGSLGSNGAIFESSESAYYVSGYIQVKADSIYNLSYNNPNFNNRRYALAPSRFCFYNDEKVFLSQSTSLSSGIVTDDYESAYINVSNETVATYIQLSVKTNGYIRIQFGKNLAESQIREGTDPTYLSVFEPIVNYTIADNIICEKNLTLELIEKINSGATSALKPWQTIQYAKIHSNVLFVGDSLTEGYYSAENINKAMSYPSVLGKFCGWTVDNKGQSGITALGWWQSQGQKVNFADYDALFIYLGTNGGLTDTIEEDTQSGSYDTFAETNTGGYCAICAKARAVNPTIKIYIVVHNTDPSTQSVTARVTMEIAEKYGGIVLEVMDDTYFDLSESLYHTDLTHYNAYGYYCLALTLLSQLEKYIGDNISSYTQIGY